MDKISDIGVFPGNPLRVETARFGPVTFQVGVDPKAVHALLLRVGDAHARFIGSPLAQVANHLEREVLVTSIFGTNTIEGGQLSEEETAAALDLDPKQVQAEQQRRVVNIRAAYELAQRAVSKPGWLLTEEFIREVHRTICRDLDDAHYQPGVFRDNTKDQPTVVGDEAHGGRYKPPQYGGDIRTLMAALVEWYAQLVQAGLPALLRAPLVHFYFETIHPFWDGNGRVGRVIEAAILHAEGFRYAQFALARYYLDQIDRYFALFNQCRKQAGRGDAHPNTPFVELHLEGMLSVLNSLHDRVNRLVNVVLFEAELRSRLDRKELNARQYAIMTQILKNGGPMPLDELRQAPWYRALYTRRTDKTRQRDLSRLREQHLLKQDRQGRLWPGFVAIREQD
jgi:Fic family protein